MFMGELLRHPKDKGAAQNSSATKLPPPQSLSRSREHGNEGDCLSEQFHIADLAGAHVGHEHTNEASRHEHEPDQVCEPQEKKRIHGNALLCKERLLVTY
jgi:hypothetical protein